VAGPETATAATTLEVRLCQALERRCAIVAIGNPLRGDDGAAQALLGRLAGRVAAVLLDTEEVPESHLGRIAQGDPEVVLLVDTMDLGAEPGAVALLGRESLPPRGFSTHRPPLSVLMAYIEHETRAEVLLLGIQPRQTEFGAPLSQEVHTTVEALAAIMAGCGQLATTSQPQD
jgi:hydrogenase 3 maturation protease